MILTVLTSMALLAACSRELSTRAGLAPKDKVAPLLQEANELVAILTSSAKTAGASP